MYDNTKRFANRGVERNKKPLKNIIYTFEVKPLKEGPTLLEDIRRKVEYAEYRFKDEGYIVSLSELQGSGIRYWNGFIHPQDVRKIIGDKQWSKFCQGKREFIIQRRINGKNVKKKCQPIE